MKTWAYKRKRRKCSQIKLWLHKGMDLIYRWLRMCGDQAKTGYWSNFCSGWWKLDCNISSGSLPSPLFTPSKFRGEPTFEDLYCRLLILFSKHFQYNEKPLGGETRKKLDLYQWWSQKATHCITLQKKRGFYATQHQGTTLSLIYGQDGSSEVPVGITSKSTSSK